MLSARPLGDLRPPPARASFLVSVHWSMAADPGTLEFMESLARSLPHGLHGLPWYLRWMMFHYSPVRELVMVQRNRLLGAQAQSDFRKTLSDSVMNVYAAQILSPSVAQSLDAYTLFVYDHLVRAGNATEARATLSRHCVRILGEYLGLPFARCVLSPQTETALWTLANCPACPSSPR